MLAMLAAAGIVCLLDSGSRVCGIGHGDLLVLGCDNVAIAHWASGWHWQCWPWAVAEPLDCH